uniref:PIN domain-containing protein n=1 Tax=Candidatus Kentrum sp. DK TaxID=2126562 RepID=A0A450TLA6_9GAMM|nr:MAG: hypothetical protein BECKDK2373B_GA0170837_12134 [Candidatus Kentron sp. DK]
MAAPGVLTDTSVIIDFLRKRDKRNSALWRIRESHVCFMSSVTLFEWQCGAVTERHSEDIGKLAKWIGTIPFDDEIAGISSIIYRRLKREHTLIEFRDIFIAATAIAENLCLATLNTKHFKRIEEIDLLEIQSAENKNVRL